MFGGQLLKPFDDCRCIVHEIPEETNLAISTRLRNSYCNGFFMNIQTNVQIRIKHDDSPVKSGIPAYRQEPSAAIPEVDGHIIYLFAGSDAGGERGAAIYSLIETAKLNGIDPEAYLRYVLSIIADHPINQVDKLLPWRITVDNDAAY